MSSTMDTLDGTEWDVVIAGTGFAQSLLALALSRSKLRILHVDQNNYYGGSEAALSLAEAEAWAERFSANTGSPTFANARVSKAEDGESSNDHKLGSSRAYSLTLAPQLIYSRTNLVGAVVSSQIHNQLDFQAVGSWFVAQNSVGSSEAAGRIVRVPSGREDVFADASLNLRAKRNLMKFLQFVGNFEEHMDEWHEEANTPFSDFLAKRFSLPPESVHPILALTLSSLPDFETTTGLALPKIARHLRSMGVFGPGFAAVLPKWGGLAEICQVACRACAVGGGVYVLGRGISKIQKQSNNDNYFVHLSTGERVTAKHLAGSFDDISTTGKENVGDGLQAKTFARSISIVSARLSSLFPPTSEGGVKPAAAVVLIPSGRRDEPPVYILVHSSEAGECPSTQCVLYASIQAPGEQAFVRISRAIDRLLEGVDEQATPNILWSLNYEQVNRGGTQLYSARNIFTFSQVSDSITIDDGTLDEVKLVWTQITGRNVDEFMVFEPRNDDEDGEVDS